MSRMAAEVQHSQRIAAVVSLLFEAGDRPTAEDILRFLDHAGEGALHARVSHVDDLASGSLEILAQGLTFDLAGLRPADPAAAWEIRHRFGLTSEFDASSLQTVTIAPGAHVAGGAAMLPVVRILAGVAAALATGLGAKAVVWHPASAASETTYFGQVVAAWRGGGAFPGLGLAALVRENGGLRSEGLAWLTGQELWVEAADDEGTNEAARLAVRLMDLLVESGRVNKREELQGPDGETYVAEPSDDGRQVRVGRLKA